MTDQVNLIFLPQSLTIGVDYNLFWTLNPKKLQPFKDSYKDKVKMQQNLNNANMWINGLYMLSAIGSAFGGKAYPDKPIEQFNGDYNEEKQIEQTVDENGMCADAANFAAYALTYNQRFKK